MSEPFSDEEDIVASGEFSSQDVGFGGWDDSDKVYLELDFATLDDLDDDLS